MRFTPVTYRHFSNLLTTLPFAIVSRGYQYLRFPACCIIVLHVFFLCQNASAQTVGLITYDKEKSFNGLTLFNAAGSKTTHLIDNCGRLVHKWSSDFTVGNTINLLDDGSILRAGVLPSTVFVAGGHGGILQRLDWDSKKLWSMRMSNDTVCQHHEIKALPNGNILVLVWETISSAEALASGRADTNKLLAWSEKIIEIRPIGTDSAELVWEWRLWDHLIQDKDSLKKNYGVISDHPELYNINFGFNIVAVDWLHANGFDYDVERDEIVLSLFVTSEVIVIDHSTTTQQAASHQGGARGRGGDILYRWGNPAGYNRGTAANQRFGKQHNPQFVRYGSKKDPAIMVFNNQQGPAATPYSSVDIVVPVLDAQGNYVSNTGPLKPDSATWRFIATPPQSMFANSQSSAQILSNGNLMTCEAQKGRFTEFDGLGKVVWRYINPDATGVIAKQGDTVKSNIVFKCIRYPYTHPAFAKRTLIGIVPIELDPMSSLCEIPSSVFDEESNTTSTLHIQHFDAVNCSASSVRVVSNQQQRVLVSLYASDGRLVRVLHDAAELEGSVLLNLDGVGSSGVYFVVAQSETTMACCKVLIEH